MPMISPAMSPRPSPARVVTAGWPLPVPAVEPPTPGPGDPAEPYSPPAPTLAPRVQVMLCRHDKTVIGEIVTAEVDDWTDELDLLTPRALSMRASSYDPIWPAAGELMGVDVDGSIVYSWDPKGYYVQVHVDGSPEPPFFFRQPVDVGGGRVLLPAVGVEAVVNERILGRAEQPDLLEGRGSFEGYGSIGEMEADGWRFDPGVTPSLVSDGVSGVTALQLVGSGWVRSPRVTLQGHSGIAVAVDGAFFARWSGTDEALDAVDAVGRARAVRRSNGAEDTAWRDAKAARRFGDVTGWPDDPLECGGRLQPVDAAHDCGVDLRSYADVTTTVDYVTLRQPNSTGFPPGTYRDYAAYVVRVMRDLHSRRLGGSPTGLIPRIVSETGFGPTQARRWAHSRRMPVREILTEILDAEGGPECRVTAGWALDIMARRGQDRDDIELSNLDVLSPGWAIDPGAQADVYAASTGRGSGTNEIMAVVEQPYASTDTAWRVFMSTQAPPDMPLDAVRAWTARQAEVAARLQVTATVSVRWVLGRSIETGDVLRVFQSDGRLGDSRRHRVVARRFRPSRMVVELVLGTAG